MYAMHRKLTQNMLILHFIYGVHRTGYADIHRGCIVCTGVPKAAPMVPNFSPPKKAYFARSPQWNQDRGHPFWTYAVDIVWFASRQHTDRAGKIYYLFDIWMEFVRKQFIQIIRGTYFKPGSLKIFKTYIMEFTNI